MEEADEALPAFHYDGVTAARHEVSVTIEAGRLRLHPSDETVPLDALVPLGDRRAALFGRRGRMGWRLAFQAPLPPAWVARLPRQEHHGGILDRIGVIPALLVGAAIAVGVYFLLSSGAALAARLVPASWEAALGRSIMRDMDTATCRGPEGQAALEALAAKLEGDGEPVAIRVIDTPLVNAAAFPGRQVVIFRGLIDQAKSPDELAGVVGHEVGHVVQHHVMAGLIRDFGISLVLGGADGGAIAQGLLSSRYSRSAESSADDYALAAMNRAAISPRPTAGFFARAAKMEGELGRVGTALSYLASHPMSEQRRRLFADGVKAGVAYRPALTAAQWRAIRTMCGGETRR